MLRYVGMIRVRIQYLKYEKEIYLLRIKNGFLSLCVCVCVLRAGGVVFMYPNAMLNYKVINVSCITNGNHITIEKYLKSVDSANIDQ